MRSQGDTYACRIFGDKEPELFEWGKAPLHTHTTPMERHKIAQYLLGLGVTAKALPSPPAGATNCLVAFLDCQLTLPLASPSRPNVVRFVPRHRSAYLDYGVYDCFYDVPGAAKAALKLERIGIWLIGQLIQLSEEQLRTISFMSEEAVRAMKEELAIFGFGFGTRIPWWTWRFKLPAACVG